MGRLVIDRDTCKGCYLCVNVCPKHLLKKSSEPNAYGFFPIEFVDERNECLGCAICATHCPDVAIKEVYK